MDNLFGIPPIGAFADLAFVPDRAIVSPQTFKVWSDRFSSTEPEYRPLLGLPVEHNQYLPDDISILQGPRSFVICNLRTGAVSDPIPFPDPLKPPEYNFLEWERW